MIKAVIYARYSSDLQSEASIEDQIRICTKRAEQEGWQLIMHFSDYAISGATMQRSGMQSLMLDAAQSKFDIVITEGLDRLSRDQEDIAGIYKRLSFANVQIFSLSDGGFVSDIHIGLKGTMNALYLKDLALKTHRGQRGRVENGKFGSGRAAYGYDIVKRFDSNGEPIRGERTINLDQAKIVRRIFEEYATGKSPRLICFDLNKDDIPNSTGKGWSSTNIHGTRSHGTGLINNELYIGKIVWNKRSFYKNPDTGKRIARTNPVEDRVIYEIPELRIVGQALWDKVKAKQDELSKKSAPHLKRRPKGLFSFLMKCSCCGEGFSKISANRYGCTAARKKGTCDNRITIAQDKLENTILNGLQTQLMHPDLLAEFCDAYEQQLKHLKKYQLSDADQAKKKLAKLEAEKSKLIAAIKQGIPADEIKDEFTRIAQQREKFEILLNHQAKPVISFKPNMAGRYYQEIVKLREALNNETHRHEAAELIRTLVDKVVLTPDEDNKHLKINIYGDLAGILSMVSGAEIKQEDLLTQTFFNHALPAGALGNFSEKQVMNDSGAKNCLLKC